MTVAGCPTAPLSLVRQLVGFHALATSKVHVIEDSCGAKLSVAECYLWLAGFSPAGRYARVPPRQVSGQLTNLQRARTCQGSLPDPDEVSGSASV